MTPSRFVVVKCYQDLLDVAAQWPLKTLADVTLAETDTPDPVLVRGQRYDIYPREEAEGIIATERRRLERRKPERRR